MKVAIIGRGFGAYAMQPAFEARGWETALIPSRDPDAVAAACAGDCDLVAVHSPPFQHREHVLLAVEAGKDVLCDKPFGINAADAREMRDAARDAGVLHFLNFEYRYQPAMDKAKQLLDSGAIGKLQHIAATAYAAYMDGRPHGWLNEADKGGGWIGAWGSHQIDVIRWLTDGEFTACSALTRIDVPERPGEDGRPRRATAEDAFTATLTLDSGATVLLDAAFALPVKLPGGMRLLGSEGAIEIVNNSVVTLHRKAAEPQVFDLSAARPDKVWPALYNWLAEIEAARELREQVAPSFEDGLAAAVVMDKLKSR